MLDLETIFDADLVEKALAVARTDPTTANAEPEIRIEDLDTDWGVWWLERAAIMEYDAGLPRAQADALALAETVREMRRQGVAKQIHRQR